MDYKYTQYTHRFFIISVVLKGINGALEIVGGLWVLFFHSPQITQLVDLFTQREAAHPSHMSPQAFASFFLLSHGIIKIVLIINLLLRHLWAYPAAILIFGLFAIYQFYRFLDTLSFWMLVLTIFDLIVILLTYLEYRNLKRRIS